MYIIAQTNPTAVLFESFFCDNKKDCDLANELGYEKIAKAIYYGLVGNVKENKETIKESNKVNKPKIVIYKSQGDKDGASLIAWKLNCEMISDDGTIHTEKYDGKDKYEIVYVGSGKDIWDSFMQIAKKDNLL
ncbi:N-acetylmuramoyl-L-alanine amidase [Peptostreptococcus porci]|uniref:N-acetylmuramoyl-L-alanine amidase n=1 Tax=Peptostreptococcus porci TaxID=2652282 RepID=UPI0012B3B2A2|nr:N-acetylmuramoyl-L-alanine amidase [Peptostreptococcus porci]